MFCFDCKKDLDPSNFNGAYRYCKNCYNNFILSRQAKIKTIPSTNDIVYFIRDGDCIKIGHTTDIEERLNTFKIGNHNELKLLKTIEGGFQKEQELHKKFEHLNKEGEWFFATKELIEFIRSL